MPLSSKSPFLFTRGDKMLTQLRGMKTGAGIHNQIFRTARAMCRNLSDDEIFMEIKAATSNCGRWVPDTEITKAINSAKRTMHRPGVNYTPTQLQQPTPPKWPTINEEQREACIAGAGVGLVDLWERSPVRFDPPASEEIIEQLFPGNPLLCVGAKSWKFRTQPHEAWRGELADNQLIVPSPMSAITGVTQDGEPSEHTLSNTGPRRFAVVEFDTGTLDEHAALLWHLRFDLGLPLVMVVHSGSKSLHGWFYVAGLPEAKVEAFYRHCVTLGADRAAFTRSQFVRMPDGLRDNGIRQGVYYFDPEIIDAGGAA